MQWYHLQHSASCDASASTNVSQDQKSCSTSFWTSWRKECNGTIYNTQHHVMPVPAPMCHRTKSHVAPHIEHLDLRNAMVPLMTLSASCDTDAANHITWQKGHVASQYVCLELANAILPLTLPSASCDANASMKCIRWPKKSCCSEFWLSWPNKCNGTTDKALPLPIASHDQNSHVAPHFDHLGHCWHYRMLIPMASYEQKVILYLLSIILT